MCMHVYVHVYVHVYICVCVYICMRVSCLNTQRQYLRPTQEIDLEFDKYVRNLCVGHRGCVLNSGDPTC